MEIKFTPTAHKCVCKECGEPFTVTTITGPTLTCAGCFEAAVTAFWALAGMPVPAPERAARPAVSMTEHHRNWGFG